VFLAFGLGEFGEQQRQLNILERSEHGNQVVHLEDEAYVTRAPLGKFTARHVRNFVAGDGDAAMRGDVKAAEKIEQSGFSRAARSHEGDKFAFVHIKMQSLQDVYGLTAPAIGFAETAYLDQTIGSASVNFHHLASSCSLFRCWFPVPYFLISIS